MLLKVFLDRDYPKLNRLYCQYWMFQTSSENYEDWLKATRKDGKIPWHGTWAISSKIQLVFCPCSICVEDNEFWKLNYTLIPKRERSYKKSKSVEHNIPLDHLDWGFKNTEFSQSWSCYNRNSGCYLYIYNPVSGSHLPGAKT